MPISVSNQAYIFLCSVLGGMLIAFIYDIFRISRKAVRTGSLFIHLEDFIYWIIIAVVMFGVVYYSNDGEIRGYIFLGAMIGVVLYVLLLSKIVVRSSLLIIRIVFKVVKTIWMIISYPFKVIFKAISYPVGIIYKNSRKRLREVRGYGRNKVSKASIWRKVLKNVRKKI